MKKIVLGLACSLGFLMAASPTPPTKKVSTCSPLLNHTLPSIDGANQSLCQYQGKVILAVNTASLCGYTPQYKQLQELYTKYQSQGLVILGFPANNFAGQEPASNSEIKKFCSDNYKVSFPLFAKTVVIGKEANPFYQGLIKETGQSPLWNFHKYLIDRQGKKVLSYESGVAPLDSKLTLAIERLLKN